MLSEQEQHEEPEQEQKGQKPELIFESEQAFVDVSEEVKKNRMSFVMKDLSTGKRYWVWARNEPAAITFLALKTKKFECKKYDFYEERKTWTADNLSSFLAQMPADVRREALKGQTGFQCPHCEKRCETRNGLSRHIKRNHSETIPTPVLITEEETPTA